jgi:hypothetical protein
MPEDNPLSYVDEARSILSEALRERLPATAEALDPRSEIDLDMHETAVVMSLTFFLFAKDNAK